MKSKQKIYSIASIVIMVDLILKFIVSAKLVENDIIKVVVIESHKGTMHMGTAYLKGMGLKKGAVGTTVAHDSHYMILAGTNDEDIAKAANEIAKMQGGKIYVENGEVKASLALPIAGSIYEFIICKSCGNR